MEWSERFVADSREKVAGYGYRYNKVGEMLELAEKSEARRMFLKVWNFYKELQEE